MSKPNVLTIGAAFYYALKNVKSECVNSICNEIIVLLCNYTPLFIYANSLASSLCGDRI